MDCQYRSMTELPIVAPKNLAASGEAKRIFWSIPFELFLKRSRAHRRCMESTTAESSPIASLFAVRHCE